MYDSIDDSSHGEDTTNDGTDVDQELEKIFLSIRVFDCIGCHCVLEFDDIVMSIGVNLVGCLQLEYLSGQPFSQKCLTKERV